MNNLKYQKIWLGLGFLAIISLTILCLLPMPNVPKVSVNDKWIHFVAYFFLGAWFVGIVKRKNYLILGVFLFAFSFLIEILQGKTKYRFFEWYDLLANGLGIFVAIVLGILFLGTWCQKLETRFFKV